MHDHWIADRMRHIEVSGIRSVMELARTLKDPVDLSIGRPDFDVPEPAKEAAIDAIRQGKNGYTITVGIAELRDRLQADLDRRYGHRDRGVLITSGTSGGLLLALCCSVNPGDEVLLFDPYFVMYPHIVTLAAGRSVYVDTYPDFQIDIERVKAALSPRTKAIMVNSPANPTGVVLARDSLKALAELARERRILLVSDEVYNGFCYDEPFVSPASFNDETLVVDGFSKTYGMTGWRLGFAHGPRRLIDEMAKLQQFSYVCAPSMVQWAGVRALDCDMSATFAAYARKRDRIYEGLKDRFEVQRPAGAFYIFPKTPWGTGSEFVSACAKNSLLVIPGNTFSRRDTHFRISYAVADGMIDRGVEILNRLAR